MRELRVFSEDGQLKAQFGNGRALRLRSQGNHCFIPDNVDDMWIAFNVENGHAESLQIHEGRWEVTPAKLKLYRCYCFKPDHSQLSCSCK